jgi:STE24 endopeptidase
VNEDKATRYHRLKRRAGAVSLVWSASLLTLLLWSGSAVELRAAAERLASAAGLHATAVWFVVALSTVMLALLHEAGSLPVSLYSGLALERRYGLSRETLPSWFRDEAKSFVVGTLLGTVGVSVVYGFIRWWPDGWWLPAGATCAALAVLLAHVAPVLLFPLFYRLRPLDRDSLRTRLLSLADRAGARVVGAYVWGLSDKTRKANAALAGLGPTRRILISDTMLAEYSDEEIEVVLAHELAHHVHGDIHKGLALQAALILVSFFAAAIVLDSSVGAFGLRGPSDVAGLPLLLLAVGAVSVVTAPVARAISRAHERSADRFALALTNNPRAFVSAMRRLSAQNLAEERPSAFVTWLFYSHPPTHERIAAAAAFDSRPSGRSVVDSLTEGVERPGDQGGAGKAQHDEDENAPLQKAFAQVDRTQRVR